MRMIRKILFWGFLLLVGLAAFVYGVDDLWARFRGRPVQQIKVDRVYSDINHWNEVEYSIGTPVIQTCVDALAPHFGYVPCWYLRKHTLQTVKTF